MIAVLLAAVMALLMVSTMAVVLARVVLDLLREIHTDAMLTRQSVVGARVRAPESWEVTS